MQVRVAPDTLVRTWWPPAFSRTSLLTSGSGGPEVGLGTTVVAFILGLLVTLCVPETKGRILR
jgi:hypothetical protein